MCACVLWLGSGHASAQDTIDPADGARFRLGGLRFTPSIAVTSVGLDDNVFNEFDDPKRDTTAAIGPAVSLWMRLGRARLSGKTSGQYLYFKRYANQRAWNTNSEVRIDLPLTRLTPFVGAVFMNSRERPGFEIDARARRRDQTITLGTSLRLGAKTSLVLSGMQSRLEYDQNETFLGLTLADALDRTTSTGQMHLRYTMTPLTTFVLTGDTIQDRFISASSRDADSIRVMTGFELKPLALISGKVGVGFRHFDVLNDQTPDYDGLVASVDARYAFASAQIQARVDRDLVYSFEATTPYYALTDFGLTLTERVTSKWDIVGRGGRQSLAYRRVGGASAGPPRVDKGAFYGLGLGYRLAETVRFGFDANYYWRRSEASDLRNYHGLRFGGSVSYGLPQ